MAPRSGHRKWRAAKEKGFAVVCFVSAGIGVVLLAALLFGIVRDGAGRLNWSFVQSFPSRIPSQAGIKAALVGTLWLIGLTAVFAVPIGVSAAIYLEEFAKRNRVNAFIQLNILNLAGVPSIVYALLGLAFFVRWMDLGRSVLAGALTLGLLILPVIIVTTQEALRAVPSSLREGSLALGATRWQTTVKQVLPASAPGIMTGIILSLSRAMGETAPLVTIGALVYVAFLPSGPRDEFTALPIQIFNWTSRPQPAFHQAAAAAILVLLIVLLTMNFAAIWIRNRFQRKM
ncbi:MAG: phosphate ABC transporter permease PstA [Fimbriimonadaceae bacterium]|nr:phosphate ABC transporter permease PstA [Fimbriimonadaceae bacterium]